MGSIYNVLSPLGDIHQEPYPVTQDQKISSHTEFLYLKRRMNCDVQYRRFAESSDRYRLCTFLRSDTVTQPNNIITLISNFRRVLNVVCFLLGYSPASEFYMPTFRNTLSLPSSQAGRFVKNRLGLRMLGHYTGKGLVRKLPEQLRMWVAQAIFEPNPCPYNAVTFSNPIHSSHTYLPMKMEQSVPKRRHIKFRRCGITQKKAYNNIITSSY